MEVGLGNAAAVDRDVAAQRGAQAVHHRAFSLLHHTARVDDAPAVNRAHHAVDAYFALRD